MIAFADASRRLVNRTVAMTLHLFVQLRETIAEARESRRKLEAELLRRHRIASKNNDDLPIVR